MKRRNVLFTLAFFTVLFLCSPVYGMRYGLLAIGVPGDRPSSSDPRYGAVYILRGSATGVTTEGAQYFTHGIGSVYEEDSKFGQTLAVGDFNDDNIPDLAVGAPSVTAMDSPMKEASYDISSLTKKV